MNKLVFLIVLAAFCLVSCDSDDDNRVITINSQDFVLFGSYAGECVGDCVDIYKLTTIGLQEAVSNDYPFGDSFYESDYVTLSESQFEIAQPILTSLPIDLLNVANGAVFGCPDCVDQGGIYIEYKDPTFHRRYYLDPNTNDLPEYLQPFAAQVQEILLQLN